MLKRIILLVLAVALAVPLAVLTLPLASSVGAQTATQQLPDLGIVRFPRLSIDETSIPGRTLLRFDALIKNKTTGTGPFEVRGTRADTSSPWSVVQRIYDSTDTTGSYTDVSTPAPLAYGGDGHSHWHVYDIAEYTLNRLDNGSKLGTSNKRGFCFYDNAPMVATQPKFYQTKDPSAPGASCAKYNTGALEVLMGLTPGWGDKYPYTLPDQYIDITDLSPGQYQLQGVADKADWFRESNESNNVCWAEIQIQGNDVRVDRYYEGCFRRNQDA